MRAVAAALLVVLCAPSWSFAEEWTEFVNREDRFLVNFPGQPSIRDATWQPQRGQAVPARVYTVQDGRSRYSVTVANLGSIREVSDVKGAIAWEAWNFRKRGGKITYDAYAQVDRIDGHLLRIINADGTETIAAIHEHDRRLYILEADVPPNTPGAVHFQQSLAILDADGKVIRYELDADGNRIRRVPRAD
jgi:hypothetical protein